MPEANKTQVGGDHYQDCTGTCPKCGAEIQHWDLFGQLPYLVGYATKEIIRHRGKEGRLGLEKAKHIIDKIIEQEYAAPVREDLVAEVEYLRNEVMRLQTSIENNWGAGVPESTITGRISSRTPHVGNTPKHEEYTTESNVVASEEIMRHEWAERASLLPLDNSPEAVRARADAFAQAKPNDDVPVGWVLEEVNGKWGWWHYRRGDGGTWSKEFQGRTAALQFLIYSTCALKSSK